MREVYVLRHANWNGKEDTLTEEGKENSKKYASHLPVFTIVYSSPFTRAQQTAEILSHDPHPHVEDTASIPHSPPEIRQRILDRRGTHPLGIAGALFETKEAHPALKQAGEALLNFIRQTLSAIQEDQKALIVSHDGTMVATERILTGEEFTHPLEQTYGELEGFKVDENLHLTKIDIPH